jgi:hypothetical protein
MTRSGGKSPITIRLELSIPTDLGAGVQASYPAPGQGQLKFFALTVSYPPPGGQALARPPGIDYRYVICTYGTVGGGTCHVAARVYPPGTSAGGSPDPHDQYVRVAIVDSSGNWRIPELPVPDFDPAYPQKKLVFWTQQSDSCNYTKELEQTVTIIPSSYTYCQLYNVPQLHPVRGRDWSRMPDRWHFKLAGCSNGSCQNCSCLNAEWVITRDKGCGTRLRWTRALDYSFADPKQPSFWRLTFNENDGFWYLDCVGTLEQPPGSWISYRRHESAWDPCGPNTLYLVTDSGYCHVPDTVTLVPA